MWFLLAILVLVLNKQQLQLDQCIFFWDCEWGYPGLAGFERVTGRKDRSLQMEDIGCKCQRFLSFSKRQEEETNYNCQIFFPSLFKILILYRRFLLKFCVALMTPGSTWSFLKPWANQCIFLMEMFLLSYVNELCIYPRLFLQVGLLKRLRPDNGSTNQYVILIQLFS